MEKQTTTQPAYDIVSGEKYTDKKSKEEKMSFTQVGVAWAKKEKDGYFLKFHLLNPTGEYQLLPRRKKGEKTPF